MLHVTNGGAAAEKIRATGLPGEVLTWDDVLHDGPVPARISDDELTAVRARFIASRGWAPEAEVLAGFRARDRALAGAAAHDETVLWFEHDLYDQLQLIQILARFATGDARSERITLVLGPEYLGPSKPERLAERFTRRRPVTLDQLAAAQAAWDAFRAPDPRAIPPLLGAPTAALPYLGAALLRHLEQFPSVRNGLSRAEQHALDAIANGAATLSDAYVAAHQRCEDPIWLGDWSFAGYVEEMARGPHPLVALANGDPTSLDRAVALTDAGRAVREARMDRVRLNGIDRWLGGVHLTGATVWRWNGELVLG